ncbi:uncharacterized protein TNCV_937081 [Trichonephila clavipes]|nr:uncharacterized protein TNCV_937081 [Trichonephila clavipes]
MLGVSHLLDRARDWYEIFGSTLVQDTDTDFAQLKEALAKNVPVVRNRKDLEVKFYSTLQIRAQEPNDFMYDVLKANKKLRVKMSEEALMEHIFSRLEPHVLDYVEVGNPTTMARLTQVMVKFEKRYSCKEMWGSRSKENMGRRDWDVRWMSNDNGRRRNWRDAEIVQRPNDRRNRYRGNYENGHSKV